MIRFFIMITWKTILLKTIEYNKIEHILISNFLDLFYLNTFTEN